MPGLLDLGDCFEPGMVQLEAAISSSCAERYGLLPSPMHASFCCSEKQASGRAAHQGDSACAEKDDSVTPRAG